MRIKIKERLALKFSLYVLPVVVIIFVSVLGYNYFVSKNLIIESNKKNIITLEDLKISEINAYLSTALDSIEDLSDFQKYVTTESELLDSLKSVVERHPQIYGCSVSYEPYMYKKDKYYFAPYFYRSGNDFKYTDLGTEKYDYFRKDWYIQPKKLNKGIWSEPYYDEGGGNVLMVTYSQPFYKTINGKSVLCGVVSCDIALDWFVELISRTKVFETGYTFVLSPKGSFLAHPNKDYYIKGQSLFTLAEEYKNPIYKKIGEDMTNGQTGYIRYHSLFLNTTCYLYYRPLKLTGWSLAIVIPEDELLSKLYSITWKLFMIGGVGYVLAFFFIIFLSSKATISLRSLVKATRGIGQGNFNIAIPNIDSSDEIGMLSRSFVAMQENLIKYVNNLQLTTAAKGKIEKELSIAREIQQNIVPHNFPKVKEFDLYAKLISAREVGGDLYDFFFIDDTHLCFAIGDVSGKGVPAALFMAITKTLLRAKINLYTNPGDIISAMNNDLCRENESMMFVTFFLCILDTATGHLEYCNAGHNPPLIKANQDFNYLRMDASLLPLGVLADVQYVTNKLKICPEDILCLYTDGITEALNKDDAQFSEENLLEVMSHNKDKSMIDIVNNVISAVEAHVSGADQSDDITLFVLKYNGGSPL